MVGDIFQKGWFQLKQPSTEIMSREGRLVLDKETLAFLPNRWCKDLYQPELCWKIFKRLCKTERSFSFKETLYKGVGVTEKTNHWEKSSIWKCFLVSVRKKRLLWEFQCLRGHLQWSYDHCLFFWRKLPIFSGNYPPRLH